MYKGTLDCKQKLLSHVLSRSIVFIYIQTAVGSANSLESEVLDWRNVNAFSPAWQLDRCMYRGFVFHSHSGIMKIVKCEKHA
jgi:hypothetical protein